MSTKLSMTTAWAHLRNAAHIDWALADLQAHPDKWVAAQDAALDDAARVAARVAAWDAALDDAARVAAQDAALDDAARVAARVAAWDAALDDAARDAARDAAWDAARDAARVAAWDAARDAAWDAARDALAALIAWDDCGHLFDMPVDAVKTLAACEHHAAVLLLPAVTIRNLTTNQRN
ncbi:hypothetical protein UFOVP48_7 [uncultured Caudovirales phage]|uniref:Uncharacterized protein n=1 Tax=uncultured Caudovirales phage TaxID=2100421 RepID=A0A6J5KMC6_9CAUD|nr:hypothetical protein UFOVP48_7 [uncultured Caudovirales phage]